MRARLKILTGISTASVEDHARRILQAIEKNEMKHPYTATPRGIPMHNAIQPTTCDECGETFWSRDPYALHKGCKGAGEKRLGSGSGFGFSS